MEAERRATESLADVLPELYRAFLPEMFENAAPEERRATCGDCAMCAPPGATDTSGYYSPDSKCCTFHPNLPNFSVGGILAGRDEAGAAGRERIRAKIREQVGVHPHGIVAPPKYDVLFDRGRGTFGRAQSLLCPYYDRSEGNCTVWPFREAVCTTYFCKHDAGADGQAFWQTLKLYLHRAQRALVDHVLLELGWEVAAAAVAAPSVLAIDGLDASWRLGPRELDEHPPSEAEYAARWGSWVGREEELYLRAHEIVSGLDRNAFDRIGGVGLRVSGQELLGTYERATRDGMPTRLARNPGLRVEREPDGSFVLTGYSPTDRLRVRRDVYELLDEFDGYHDTGELLERFAQERGLRVAPSLVQKLVHHRILVECPAAGGPSSPRGARGSSARSGGPSAIHTGGSGY